MPVVISCAARLVSEHARQDANRVRLLPLRREFRLAGPSPIEIALDIGGGERNPRRTAIDHAAERGPVAFAKGRDAKQKAEGVEGHRICSGLRVVVARAFHGVKYAPIPW